jgi:two-component system sensor histidine kinase DevS
MDLEPVLAAAVVAQAPDGIVVVDRTGRIEWANERLHEMLAYAPGELVGRSVEDLVPARLRPAHEVQRQQYEADPKVRPMGAGLDLRAVTATGEEVPVEIALSPVHSPEQLHVVAIVRDITERRAAEASLRAAEEALAIADERERIARDLHDTVIQRLFATGLALQATAARTPDQEVSQRLAEAVDEIDVTIRQVRNAIFELHAPLPGASLRREVLELTRRAARALGFEPRVEFTGPVDAVTTDSVRAAVMASLQEALSNAARHAGASSVTVHVDVGEALRLRVSDDGTGFDPVGTSGSGLHNLRTRAGELGGHCTIISEPGRGTTIDWRVPVPT